MFKRLTIVLVAVGLVTIFIAEAANARAIRLRRTVENVHECSSGDCVGAKKVTDRIFGAVEVTPGVYKPACEMTGTLVCEKADECGLVELYSIGLTQDSFVSDADFTDENEAIGIAVYETEAGEIDCLEATGGTYSDYKPNAIMVKSEYFSPASAPTPFYTVWEVCPDYSRITDPDSPFFGTDVFDCTKMWDSNSTAEEPKLPCCGVSNTLSVGVIGNGTVTSDDENINCSTDCEWVYNGTTAPIDACPEVTLTATPENGLGAVYTFTGWSGDCSGTALCTVIPPASVTATFEADSFLLTVTLSDRDSNDRVRIFNPSDLVFQETGKNVCDRDQCTVWVDLGVSVVLKKQGDSIMWGGVCDGVPNNNTNCAIVMDAAKEAIVFFDN
jgi:hypothetical protein